MESGQISEKARTTVLTAVHVVKSIKPKDNNQQAVFPILLQETINWWEKRRDRTRSSMFGIPVAEWVVLVVGAIITTMFTFFFHGRKPRNPAYNEVIIFTIDSYEFISCAPVWLSIFR